MSRLSVNSFVDPSRPRAEYPILKSKAAEARALLPVILDLCDEFSAGTNRDQLRLRCARSLNLFYDCCGASGTIMSEPEAGRADAAMTQFLLDYMRLSANAAAAGTLLFNVVNKHHFCLHLKQQCRYLNPEAVWCYPFEDLVGRSQRVAMKCKAGTRPPQIANSYMDKYRQVLHCAVKPFY
jgi:hypothetical protein